MSPRELLDVEDDDTRRQRIQSLLESTDAAASSSRSTLPRPLIPLEPPSRPHPVPISDLISRAEAFLPRLAASNADLGHRAALDPASVDIENIDDAEDGTYIEMNLGLGVFEQRTRNSARTSNSSNSSSDESESSSESESGSSNSEESDDDENTPATSGIPNPLIQVLHVADPHTEDTEENHDEMMRYNRQTDVNEIYLAHR
ncbi:hypothetical protein K439DRAFT_1664940 [Ramaria rubella]|nr:hypothetical protein K439DRAFT_1664940 [Ramaria rubella]